MHVFQHYFNSQMKTIIPWKLGINILQILIHLGMRRISVQSVQLLFNYRFEVENWLYIRYTPSHKTKINNEEI